MCEIAAGELTPELAAEAAELRDAHSAAITAQESTEVVAEASADTEVTQERASKSVFIQNSNKMSNYKQNLLGEAIARMGTKTVGQHGDNVDAFLNESRSSFNGNSFTMDFGLAGEYMEERAVSGVDTTSAGIDNDASGFVPTSVAPAAYTLLNATFFDKLDANIMRGLTGNTIIPVAGAVATGTPDEGVAITASMADVAERTLTPKRVVGAAHVSEQLLIQGGAAVEQMLVNNIGRQVRLAKEEYLLTQLVAGLTATTFANDLDAAATLKELEQALMLSNGDIASAAALIDPNGLGFFREAGLNANFAGNFAGTRGLYDYPTAVTNSMTDNEVILGNFQDFVIGEWGQMTFKMDEDIETGITKVVGSTYTAGVRVNDGSFAYYDSIGAVTA